MPNWPDVPIKPAIGVSFYTPAQHPVAGTARNPQTSGKAIPKIFQPLTIRGLTFHNRLAHLAHYGNIAQRGPGMMLIEATAVLPEGRITPGCVIELAHSQGQKIGIQLAHAGRKASTTAPWVGGGIATNAVGGWVDNVKGPSAIPFLAGDDGTMPHAMTEQDIRELKSAWVAATRRALAAGADFIEIHAAHGYLPSSFLSPASNARDDQYGACFDNRIRLPLGIAQLTRDTVGPEMPVFLRVSATDWDPSSRPGWKGEDTKITAGPAFQVPFAAAVKKAVGDRLHVAAVGMINNGVLGEKVLQEGLNVVMVGRSFQRDTGLAWRFARDLDVEIAMACQIRWGFTRFRNASEFILPNSMKASFYY
ncbi:NADH-dependent flavin oxidoreductase [Aspergillus karnatakaensis]|uniref:NADH-dependent flavin oxidoreductase n=1 Tax=Aspergillus karnatakaensis TaxID=1810916 RepID=UPI003CCD0B64